MTPVELWWIAGTAGVLWLALYGWLAVDARRRRRSRALPRPTPSPVVLPDPQAHPGWALEVVATAAQEWRRIEAEQSASAYPGGWRNQ